MSTWCIPKPSTTLNQLPKSDAAMAARIVEVSKIVAFRNQLIHSYAVVDSSLVWNIAQKSLPDELDSAHTLYI